jgi:uncharacterized protein YcaQ
LTEAIQVSNPTARRFILGKQGLWPGRRGRGKAGTRAAMTACEHVQLDPLVIVGRSHDLMLHARVAGYRPELFHQLTYTERRFFDWGGWLAVRPMHELPYWRVLMRRARQIPGMRRIDEHLGATLNELRAALRDRGTLSSRDFAAADRLAVDTYRGKKDSSLALYYLWLSGEAMTHHREGFERVYALTEAVAPADLIAEADETEADRFMVRKHVAFGGIGRIGPLSAVLGRKVSRPEQLAIVRELVETNEITPVDVVGWRDRAFMLTADLALLRAVDAGRVPKAWRSLDTTTEEEVALLSPLDPVLERRRASALFGFDYVWEIYKRPDLVQYGRFAMPVLWGDRLVGRVDLRTDRPTKTLVVNGIWLERATDARSTDFRAALRVGLARLAALVGADHIDATAVIDARLRRALNHTPLHR